MDLEIDLGIEMVLNSTGQEPALLSMLEQTSVRKEINSLRPVRQKNYDDARRPNQLFLDEFEAFESFDGVCATALFSRLPTEMSSPSPR